MGNIAPPLKAVIVLNILLLEDSDDDALLVERALSGTGYVYSLKRARDMAEFIAQLDPAPDLILSDYHLSDCNALDALDQLKERGLDIPLILMSGRARDEDAIEAIKRGAADFLSKDRLGRLGPAIAATLERRALRQQAHDIQQALEHNREELDYAFDTAAIGIALTSLDGRWLKVNQALCRITGYTEPGLLATDCHSITHQGDIAVDIDLMKQLVAGEVNSTQREKRYVHQLGHVVWVQVTASLVRDRDGTPCSRMLQVLDITHRKEAEERFQATFNQAAVGIAHTTTDGRIFEVNRKLCDILGYSAQELLRLTTRDLTHPDDRDRQDNLRLELLAGSRQSFSGEKRYVRLDGKDIWVNRTVTLARQAAGGDPYLIQVIEDISKRKRTEEHLERANRARRVLAECSRAMVHGSSEEELLQKMCRIVVKSGAYVQAYIGFAQDDEQKSVRPVASAGFEEGYLEQAKRSEASGGRQQSVMGRVIANGRSYISRDIFTDSNLSSYVERARQRGYQSLICLPLKVEGRCIGGISIYAREADAFDEEEIALLATLADDIAFGVAGLRTRVARQSAEAALRESEQRSRETFEQAAVGITHVDLNGVLVDVNQKFCDMLGYARDELLGKTVKDITHPDDYGRGSQYRKLLAHGASKAMSGEKRFLRKDGTIMWARRTMSPACDDAGNPQYLISVVEDITERKELEHRFELTFNHAAVGMTQSSLDGHFLQVNQKFTDMLGYTREELLGMTSEDVTHPDDRAETGQLRQKLLSRQVESVSSEKRLVHKDGRVIWVNRTFSVARGASGEPLYFIAVVDDITGRKELERRYRETFDQAAVGIVHTAIDGRYLRVNQKFCEMLGYSESELAGRPVADFAHPEDREKGRNQRQLLWEGKLDKFSEEKRYIRKDGGTIWTNRSVSLARDESGKPLYFIRVIEDITERKEAEERYRATFDNAPIGIMHTEIDTYKILHANPKLCEMLGYTLDELQGMTSTDVVHPDYRFSDKSKYKEQILSGESQSFASERKFIRKDCSTIWVNRTVSLVRDAAGKPLYFIRIIEDISERKQAEEALRTSEEALRATNERVQILVESSPLAIYTRDTNGLLTSWNPAAEKMYGWKASEVLGKPLPSVPGESRAESDALRKRLLAGEPFIKHEARRRRRDGSPIDIDASLGPLRDHSGNVTGIIAVVADITERMLSARRGTMEHAVTRVLSESATLDDAMPAILQTICEGLGWACGAHWRWDDKAEVLQCAETWHVDAKEVAEFVAVGRKSINEAPTWLGRAPGTKTGGLVRSVWFSGTPVWLPDVAQQPGFRRGPIAAKAGLHCAFGFPVLAGAQPLGVMEFYSRDIKQPDEALLQVVRAIGSQIGQFIQRKEAEQSLRKSEERYRDLFELSPLPMWVWNDEKLAFLAVNEAAVNHYGYTRDEFLRMNVRDIWAPGEEARYEENLRDRAQEQTLYLQRRHRTKDERIIDVEVTAQRVTLSGSSVWLTVVNDISDRLRAERALRQSEEQFRQLAGNIPQVFWITDVTQKQVIYVSPASEQLLGVPVNVLQANPRKLVQAVHRDDRPRVFKARKSAALGEYDETYQVVRPDGSIRWVHERAFPVHDDSGTVYRIAGIAEDVTDRKLAEERLMQLAHYDVLTSLPNRVLFYDRLKQALAQSKRNQWITGVMFIDVDRFKNVNDTLGHAVGDQLLQQISERLTRSVRTGDTVGRLGGDEFAIVLSNLSSAQDTNLVAQKIMANFDEPFKLEGSEIYVTASIGITLYPDDSTEQDTLIKNADAAMYRAKEAGRNNFQFYTPEMNARALEILNMENSLRHALDRNELLLYYQPKTSVADGNIVGVEALLRWQHPERGLVSPIEFIPVLEESGLIVPVGEWVLKTVCAQIKAWERAGVTTVPVAVNLSARQFTAKNLGPTIQRILEEYQVDPALIELEITESCIMANAEEATRTLEYLEHVGVGLSIDDFGTGYSSLGYLKRFPLDALKIDHSFVRDLTTDADDATITRAVISMAHSLGLKVIAEGVETESQLAFLAEYGCDEIQGYYFSRPLAVQECGTWLGEKRRLQRPRQVADSDTSIVLLVDDDDDALTLLKRSLGRDGYQILAARNAHEALELLGQHHVDVVISDQKMPGIPGVEFLQRVKSLFPKTIRMMTSNYTDFQTMADAVNKGEIFRFLPKNLSEEELRIGVREALRARADAAVNIGHLVAPGTVGK